MKRDKVLRWLGVVFIVSDFVWVIWFSPPLGFVTVLLAMLLAVCGIVLVAWG